MEKEGVVVTRLARGMTVQSDERGHYAFCVRCFGESPRCKFAMARHTASKPCPRCSKKMDVPDRKVHCPA